MPITINGSGTVTGISAGGLPDASIVTADIADANVTAAKLSGAQTGSAPIYGCRAWVNFNGAGTVSTNQTIRASGNVTSVFKNGTGDYTITFATAMVDADYAVCSTTDAANSASLNASIGTVSYATSSIRLLIEASNGVNIDSTFVSVAIFR